MSLDSLFNELDAKDMQDKLKQEHRFPLHLLRKILDEFDATMLGELLDAFHMFHDYHTRHKLDMSRFVWLVEFNAIASEPRFVDRKCPEMYRDVLVKTYTDVQV
jgi:hypothetical protein